MKTSTKVLSMKVETTFTGTSTKSEKLVRARVHRTIINPDLTDKSLVDWSCAPLGKIKDLGGKVIGHANLVTVIYRVEFHKVRKPKKEKR